MFQQNKMLNEREEALNDFKEQLEKLKDNNKNQIQLITLIADDHSQYAEDIVKIVINHIKEAPSELKLYGVYAMDSIIKFPTGTFKEKYCRLFGNEIVELFVDTFKKVFMIGLYFFSIAQSLQLLIIGSIAPRILFIDS
uniref:CID domain-containing protein n=1 Tax=Panagrolaimus davidi TaxID=227884 RepID=A0A914QXG5_9BILA